MSEKTNEQRKYEVVYIIGGEDTVFSELCQKIRDDMSGLDITIDSEEDMGKKKLAYEIKKNKEGHYYLFNVTMDPTHVKALSGFYTHEDNILRHLVIRK